MQQSTGKCSNHPRIVFSKKKRMRYEGTIPKTYTPMIRACLLRGLSSRYIAELLHDYYNLQIEIGESYIVEIKTFSRTELLNNAYWWFDCRSRSTNERYKYVKKKENQDLQRPVKKQRQAESLNVLSNANMDLIFWTKNYAYWGPIVRRTRRSTMAFYEMWDYYIFPHLMLPLDGREKSRAEFDSWKGLINVPRVSSLLSDLASCILPYYYAQERLACLGYKRVDRMLIMNLSLHMRGNHHLFCSLIHIIHKRNKDRVIQHVD